MKCKKCGSEIANGLKFCIKCGEKIEVSEETTSFKEIKFCPFCGTERIPGMQFCANCGKHIDNVNKQQEEGKEVDSNRIITESKPSTVEEIEHQKTTKVERNNKNDIEEVGKKKKKKSPLNWLLPVCALLILFGVYSSKGNNTDSAVIKSQVSDEVGAIERALPNDGDDSELVTIVQATVPYSSTEAVGLEYSEIQKSFEDAGFSNVSVEYIEDLKADETDKVNTIEKVMVGEAASFEAGSLVDSATPVVIQYHTYAECPVNIHIVFSETGAPSIEDETIEGVNQEAIDEIIEDTASEETDVDSLAVDTDEKMEDSLLEKSNSSVTISMDNSVLTTIKIGTDGDCSLNVKPGTYELAFDNGNSSETNVVDLEVGGEQNVGYIVYEDGEDLVVSLDYIEKLYAASNTNIMIDSPIMSYSSYDYANYEALLMLKGFENISVYPVYDIPYEKDLQTVDGANSDDVDDSLDEIEDDGLYQRVAEVSFDGGSQFQRGDFYSNDSEVVIYYHMPEEEDPDKFIMSEDPSEYISKDYMEVKSSLIGQGFGHVSLKKTSTHDTSVDGSVIAVTIDGEAVEEGALYSGNTIVAVDYYAYEPVTVMMKKSESDYLFTSYTDAKKELNNLGFTSITVEEKEISDSDVTKINGKDGAYEGKDLTNKVASIKIDGSSFSKWEKVEVEKEVVITYYKYVAPKPAPTTTTTTAQTTTPATTTTTTQTTTPATTTTTAQTTTPATTTVQTPTPQPDPTPQVEPVVTPAPAPAQTGSGNMVWIPATGAKYHSKSSCSNMNNPSQVTEAQAISLGYEKCKKCYK